MSDTLVCEVKPKVKLTVKAFGDYVDTETKKVTPTRLFTWTNEKGVTVKVTNYGGTIVSIEVPGKDGSTNDIVSGFDSIYGYVSKSNRYFGCSVGRVANRVGNSKFSLEGETYEVTKNFLNKHQLHGGFKGFDKVVWDYYISGTKLILSYHSADGEEGYPGDLVVNTTFELNNFNSFSMNFIATTTKPTVVNLTNHSYFNLAGHKSGAEGLYEHVIQIDADKITAVDEDAIPTGETPPVEGTVFDLREPKVLGDVIHKVPGNPGFDHNFCTKGSKDNLVVVARATHPKAGRTLELHSNQPGVQFYTGNFLHEETQNSDFPVKGKDKANYNKHGLFCLEPQVWPDAPNHNNFPSAVLLPGQIYDHKIVYKFLLEKP